MAEREDLVNAFRARLLGNIGEERARPWHSLRGPAGAGKKKAGKRNRGTCSELRKTRPAPSLFPGILFNGKGQAGRKKTRWPPDMRPRTFASEPDIRQAIDHGTGTKRGPLLDTPRRRAYPPWRAAQTGEGKMKNDSIKILLRIRTGGDGKGGKSPWLADDKLNIPHPASFCPAGWWRHIDVSQPPTLSFPQRNTEGMTAPECFAKGNMTGWGIGDTHAQANNMPPRGARQLGFTAVSAIRGFQRGNRKGKKIFRREGDSFALRQGGTYDPRRTGPP